MSRSDPIRKDYYTAVEKLEKVSGILFYFSAGLSCATLLVDSTKQPSWNNFILILFSLSVITIFLINQILRLYLIPRAEDRRRQDFFGCAYGVNLFHKKTNGYYNNNAKEPVIRIAAQILENSHFSKAITLRMARVERNRIVLYFSIWILLLHYRSTDISWLIVASQVIFSEQIVSKWIRLEWLNRRYEKIFESLYKLMQSKLSAKQRDAQIMEYTLTYETTKANAGIILSSKYFDEMNPSLSDEWGKIRDVVIPPFLTQVKNGG